METKKAFIESFANDFTSAKRENGKTYYFLKTDKYKDIFRKIHGTDFLPDDFRYDVISSILNNLTDYDLDYSLKLDQATEDIKHELVDGLVPIYNNDLLNWLSSNLNRAYYVDDAAKEGLISSDTDEYKRIACGCYLEVEELFYNTISELDDYFQENGITN